ncbi:MAG: ABC transporter permease [Candidatus Omnitrophica bacterium]|nr:ABC transporter permease [Candidatus Omnitrophota bacterium]
MIELKNIYKTYQMGKVQVKALDGVSLSVGTGEFLAIMGPSGSGKSTLMHVLGLLDKPDKGEYLLGGNTVNDIPEEKISAIRNLLAGFIFQQFHLLPRMSALENVKLPLIYAGRGASDAEAERRIKDVGLEDRGNHRPNELSGGQQQRVAIARALVNDPLLILADEPTGNLDSKSKEEIMSILRELNDRGKTVIVVTHEDEVAAYAKRVIRMRDGRVISDEKKRYGGRFSSQDQVDKIFRSVMSSTERVSLRGKVLDCLRQAVVSMLSHKMRSVLSILGILIGVAAVIAMLALGQGAKESIEKQLASLGSNLLVIRPGSSRIHGVSMEAGTVTRFTFRDVRDIHSLFGLVKKVCPSVNGKGQIVYGNKNWSTQVEGVGVDYAEMRAAIPVLGRFFSEEEMRMREKVAVLGQTVVRELFGDQNPVGETIKVNGVNFKVIGILPSKGGDSWRDRDDNIVIPITTAMFRVFGKEYIDSISVEIVSPQLIDSAQEEIKALIITKHRLDKKDEDSFQIRNMSEIKSTLESTTKTMSLLLGAIAAISLLVGGIGIMNIMLVSVTERTREIGLRKAIGANNKDILVQFIIEAVLMSFIGGISGIILGTGAAVLITLFAGWSVKITVSSIVMAVGFSVAIGVFFGIWPAKQASKLDPIEALRYE